MNGLRIHRIVFVVFTVLWTAILFVDYLDKNEVYLFSLKYFRYTYLLLFFLSFSGVLSLYFKRIGPFKKIRRVPLNGLVVTLVVIVFLCSTVLAFNHYWRGPLSWSNYAFMIGKALYTMTGGFVLVSAAYVTGLQICKKIDMLKKKTLTSGLISISLGFSILTPGVMLLASLGLLNAIGVGIILLIPLIADYKSTLFFGKKCLWDSIKIPKNMTVWGGWIAGILTAYMSMNLLFTLAPFPLGFDSRNYYVNLSQLLAERESLVMGFQPYAWSLIQSIGLVLFQSIEITLFISTLGAILCIPAIYTLSTRFFRVSPDMAFAIVLLFLATPAVTNHLIVEFKIDLALLFVQISTLIMFFTWFFKYRRRNKKAISIIKTDDYKAATLIGMLLGYSLSIKVLGVFLIFALILGILWKVGDELGAIGVGIGGVGLVLFLRLDELSGLRQYHEGVDFLSYVFIMIGLGLIIYAAYQNKDRSLITVKLGGTVLLTCFLWFSPWMIKNYTYSGSLSPRILLMGQNPTPPATVPGILRKYEQSIKAEGNE